MARPAGASARHNGVAAGDEVVSIPRPLKPAELTTERCKVARDILRLDYREFLEDLDSHEEAPASIVRAAERVENTIYCFEALIHAWRRKAR